MIKAASSNGMQSGHKDVRTSLDHFVVEGTLYTGIEHIFKLSMSKCCERQKRHLSKGKNIFTNGRKLKFVA